MPLFLCVLFSQPQAEPIAQQVAEYAQQLDVANVPLMTPEQYLQEIATQLEFKLLTYGIEELPGGHSWHELTQIQIGTINPDLTDISTLTYVYALVQEGFSHYNPILTKALV